LTDSLKLNSLRKSMISIYREKLKGKIVLTFYRILS